MANEKRLIDANELTDRLNHTTMVAYPNLFPGLLAAVEIVDDSPTVDAVELPCKIGDYAWAIRNYKGHIHPQRGIVSEMYFIKGMKLCVAVKNVGRGEWGKTIFATDKDAYAAIERKKGNA